MFETDSNTCKTLIIWTFDGLFDVFTWGVEYWKVIVWLCGIFDELMVWSELCKRYHYTESLNAIDLKVCEI